MRPAGALKRCAADRAPVLRRERAGGDGLYGRIQPGGVRAHVPARVKPRGAGASHRAASECRYVPRLAAGKSWVEIDKQDKQGHPGKWVTLRACAVLKAASG